MTDAEFNAWLVSPSAVRMILVEAQVLVGGIETTRYLSTHAYVNSATNQRYDAVVRGSPTFPEKVRPDDEPTPLTGNISLSNQDGLLDSWLGDVWRNRPVRGWLGDPRWPRSDFRLVFNGITDDIDSADVGELNIKLRDKLQRLNTPVSEVKLGGTTQNKDELLPVALGECHNITPLLTNPTVPEYQFHAGASERLIEVRDNGKPIVVIGTLAAGKFALTAAAAGTITASIQGDKTGGVYANTIASIIQRLVTSYGKASERFTAADIDADNFAGFESLNPQPVGLYLKERTNVLVACKSLASSVGAIMMVSRDGLLQLLQLVIPAAGTPQDTIADADIVQNSLKPTWRSEVVAGVQVGFCRDYTVQENLMTTLPDEHKSLFATEWLTETVTDAATQANYRLHVEPTMRETCLLRRVDANAEAARDLAFRSVPRTIYEMTCFAKHLTLDIGQPITLVNRRFGLTVGRPGIVVGFDPNYIAGRVTVEVMV